MWATWPQWLKWDTGNTWATWWTWATWATWATGWTWAKWATWATGTSYFMPSWNNIYYDLWSVGIGLNNPGYALDVSWIIHTNLWIQIWSSLITTANISNRNTAFGRWNHATMGYLTGGALAWYLTWFTEVDPKIWNLVNGQRCYASGATVVCDQPTPTATPGGADTQIQFNNKWLFDATKDLVWSSNKLGINTETPSQALDVSWAIKGMNFISSLNNTWITMSVPFTYSGSNYCLRIENGLIVGFGNLTIDVGKGTVECTKDQTGSIISRKW